MAARAGHGEDAESSPDLLDPKPEIMPVSRCPRSHHPPRRHGHPRPRLVAVQRGEHWVILGANGSGKTSLLSALTGYLSPTDGDISVLGQTFRRERLARTPQTRRPRQFQHPPDDPRHEPALTSVICGSTP